MVSLVGVSLSVSAQAPKTESIPNLSDIYVIATNAPIGPYLPSGGTQYAYSCVAWAKYVLGHSQSKVWGNANQIQPTVAKPYVGGLVLTREGKFGHVAIIEKIEGNTLSVIEANYIPNVISTRSLSLDNTLIRGFK